MNDRLLTSWIVTDGAAGAVRQCAGLARRLGLDPLSRRIVIRQPWRSLPPSLWLRPLSALSPAGDRLAAPWPDLVIASGRKSAAPAAAIRRASAGRTIVVQIQKPNLPPRHFDLLAVPRHDGLEGSNVVVTTGSLHGLTRRHLDEAARRRANDVARLPRPLVFAAIGGPNRAYRFAPDDARALGRRLEALEGGLLVTVSRRTPDDTAEALVGELDSRRTVVWTGKGANPYDGWLGLADAIVTTSDSVNMATEACATGRPVHIAHLPGGSPKFRRFHESLRRLGHARTFDGAIDMSWRPVVLDDTRDVAARVGRLLEERFSWAGSMPGCSGRP